MILVQHLPVLHFAELTSFRSKLSGNACYLRSRTYPLRIPKEICKFPYCFFGRCAPSITSENFAFMRACFPDTRHCTLHTGSPLFAITSRHLARSILYQHLKSLQIDVFAFENTTDPLWLDYRRVNRVCIQYPIQIDNLLIDVAYVHLAQ